MIVTISDKYCTDSNRASFRLYQRCKHADKSKQLPCPAMNTHDAITKTCMDNYYRDGWTKDWPEVE